MKAIVRPGFEQAERAPEILQLIFNPDPSVPLIMVHYIGGYIFIFDYETLQAIERLS